MYLEVHILVQKKETTMVYIIPYKNLSTDAHVRMKEEIVKFYDNLCNHDLSHQHRTQIHNLKERNTLFVFDIQLKTIVSNYDCSALYA